jgi:arylformamidase
MTISYLSHFIKDDTPEYGGKKSISIVKTGQISEGASANSTSVSFSNHIGTHIDFPLHFSDTGKSLSDYPASFWTFEKVHIVNCHVGNDVIISETTFAIDDIPRDTEFLLIYTGFGRNRGKDIYWNNNPGFSPSLARLLRNRCPKLKVIGFDFISLSSYQDRPLGRIAHKEFLIREDILIIEDMNLDQINDKVVNRIIALPILIKDIDGCPITIIAEISND